MAEPVKNAIVEIVWDRETSALRGQANDGVHGTHWVQIAKEYRDHEGNKYQVEEILYDAEKELYKVSGEIIPVFWEVI